jgi:transaldolase
MAQNPLRELQSLGQSVWLDFLSRGLLKSGQLARLIEEDGLSGVTSNPAIFEKAINGSTDYDGAIRELAQQGMRSDMIYRELVVADVTEAADLLRPVYDRTRGRDGFVSLEVSPLFASDPAETVAEAHGLWRALLRHNVFIKVPATEQGIPAIRELIAEGINVNVTLLFSLVRYREVVRAYLEGLQMRLARGLAIDEVASVASFFLSRIDTLLDPQLEQAAKQGGASGKAAGELVGEVAIASAKRAYQIYQEVFQGPEFALLREHGARPQRLLWASTSTKNPAYPDVKYVEALIGAETINTMPLETIEAYRDHGAPRLTLEDHMAQAQGVLAKLREVSIDLDAVTEQLEDEGVVKFVTPFESLMRTLEAKRRLASTG